MTTTKKILIALAIVAVILIGIFWKKIWNFISGKKEDLTFGFDIGGNIPDVLNTINARYASRQNNEKGIGLYVDVPLTTKIGNNKATPLNLQNLFGTLAYNGEIIMQTKNDSQVLQNINVASKGQPPTTITDTVQVLVNPSTIKYFTELVSGNKPKIQYNFNATILGAPHSFRNVAIINQQPVK